MANIGPVILEVEGDTFVKSARILSIIWEGGTTAGDQVELECPVTRVTLWPGRTNASYTYLGISFGDVGLHAPFGFRLKVIHAGRVLVYLREN